MLNQAILVGRIVKDLEVKETEKGKKVSTVTLAIQRPYKNDDGEYDVDYLDCVLFGGVAENTSQYCQKGDLIGIKGRIGSTYNAQKQHVMEIVAEKVTFLTSKKSIDDSEINKVDYEENISI